MADRGSRALGAALGVLAAAALAAVSAASGCVDHLAQPNTDAGKFILPDHPPPTMYGSPCLMGDLEPEPCCGEVAKAIPGKLCYGCTTSAAYAICVSGAFNCTCTCDPPEGYALLPADAATEACPPGERSGTDSSADAPGGGDAPAERASDAQAETSSDAAAETSTDAPPAPG